MTESFMVRASEGTCFTRQQLTAENLWPGILVSISQQSNFALTQALCIDMEDFNGTKDPSVKVIGDDS